MDVNSERHVIIPWRPFPKDNIIDPVHKFDPDQTCKYLIRGAPLEALVQISNFCFRVSALSCEYTIMVICPMVGKNGFNWWNSA